MIDKSSVVPIYYQLKTLIQNRIAAGEYPVGARLPSERELCELHGISRMTVRQAVNDLVNEGRLTREQGRGTFVAKPKIEQGLVALSSFTEEMKRRSLIPGTKLLGFRVTAAEGRVAERLGVAAGEPIHEITRLRLADNEPMAIEISHLPLRYVPSLPPDLVAAGSLYEILRSSGIDMAYAEQTLEASLAKAKETEILRVKPKAPVLLMERTTYRSDGRAVEYVKSVYRADRYRFSIRLTGSERYGPE
ncbi:MAG TPA: GntR family transcriptional regulator [Selenomonadales bacterium]|nr:GntR family transcriptional regulator [Selenomonadales bacterium]